MIGPILVASWLFATAAQAQPSEPLRWSTARQAVARADALFAVGNYEAALVDFSRAYDMLEGYARRYIVLHNIAACYERMFRYDEALRYYGRYLVEGGPTAEGRATIEASIAALRAMLASLRVEANVRGEVWVDARHSGEVPADLRLPAGRHRIAVRAALHESAERELTLEAGGSYLLRVDLKPLSTYRGPSRSLFYVAAVTTGVVLAAAAVLGANTLAARNRGAALAQESMHVRTPETARAEANMRRWALATDLTLGGAALLGAASLLLYFLTDWSSEQRGVSPLLAGLAK